MRLVHRPIDLWPGKLLSDGEREYSRFSATWTDTLQLLEREVDHLCGRAGAGDVVLQVAVREQDIRLDGGVRANARPAEHPGVVLSFESRHGPLRYSTDQFKGSGNYGGLSKKYLPGWQANVRAIALGLEALRRVDRYGISKGGEQYVGYRQLGAGTPMGPATMTVEEAARLLSANSIESPLSGRPVFTAAEILGDPGKANAAYRIAARKAHPDAGGDPDEFRRLGEAKAIVEAYR